MDRALRTIVTLSNCPLPPIERKRLCWMVKDYLDEATTPSALKDLRNAFQRSTHPHRTEYARLFRNAVRYATRDQHANQWHWQVDIT